VGLCMWVCACGFVHVGLCMCVCACVFVHVGLCMWVCACVFVHDLFTQCAKSTFKYWIILEYN